MGEADLEVPTAKMTAIEKRGRGDTGVAGQVSHRERGACSPSPPLQPESACPVAQMPVRVSVPRMTMRKPRLGAKLTCSRRSWVSTTHCNSVTKYCPRHLSCPLTLGFAWAWLLVLPPPELAKPGCNDQGGLLARFPLLSGGHPDSWMSCGRPGLSESLYLSRLVPVPGWQQPLPHHEKSGKGHVVFSTSNGELGFEPRAWRLCHNIVYHAESLSD